MIFTSVGNGYTQELKIFDTFEYHQTNVQAGKP